jgi:hydroxypyruvate reductase
MVESDRLKKLLQEPNEDARTILAAALERVDPLPMMESILRLEDDRLQIKTETEDRAFNLRDFDRIVAFGAGKASARMALGLERVLGDRLAGGVIAVKAGQAEPLTRIELLKAAHPVPDATSIDAAKALLGLGRRTDERTLCIGLTSGGGSALLCAPLAGLSLEDKQATTRILLGCGASIREINCVRKHLSAIKGGRLAVALAPATVVNLILSDVIGDDPSAIASGITAPDPTRFEEAISILVRYRALERVPASVRRILEQGQAGLTAETPKSSDSPFGRTHNLIIGSNHQAVLAAQARAISLGYATLILTSRLEGEAREAARFLLAIAEDVRDRGFPLAAPACLLCGGETTVTLQGNGLGGRNQELALAALACCQQEPERLRDITLLSAGTDGGDGPTDAAGAFASGALLARARRLGLAAREYLERNDSYRFFEQIGGHLKTGPTNTNVCDIQVVLVAPV